MPFATERTRTATVLSYQSTGSNPSLTSSITSACLRYLRMYLVESQHRPQHGNSTFSIVIVGLQAKIRSQQRTSLRAARSSWPDQLTYSPLYPLKRRSPTPSTHLPIWNVLPFLSSFLLSADLTPIAPPITSSLGIFASWCEAIRSIQVRMSTALVGESLV